MADGQFSEQSSYIVNGDNLAFREKNKNKYMINNKGTAWYNQRKFVNIIGTKQKNYLYLYS